MGLVISRETDEKIIIGCPNGDRIEVMVTETRSDRVRIKVDAPREYSINRNEVQDRIDAAECRARRRGG